MKKVAMQPALGDRVTDANGLEGTVVGLGEFLFTEPKALVYGKVDDGPLRAVWVKTATLAIVEGEARLSLVHGGYPTAVIAAA